MMEDTRVEKSTAKLGEHHELKRGTDGVWGYCLMDSGTSKLLQDAQDAEI